MGQRTRILTEILGFRGWNVRAAHFEDSSGEVVMPLAGYGAVPIMREGVRLVLKLERRWAPRCSQCGAICPASAHERLAARRWQDLPWAGRTVMLEACPIRVKCPRCKGSPVEMVAWADRYQRQTRRLQHHLALEAASMPVMHVAMHNGLSWGTVRRAEGAALARWAGTRSPAPLTMAGVDEKYLGRRGKRDEPFVTVVSNLETGEPLWIGLGRREATLQQWIATLTSAQKAAIVLVATDMHQPFANAIMADPELAHVVRVHDPFHIIKRAGEAITELRREVFFRAGGELRRLGRGTRWLVLRAWERCDDDECARLQQLFALNGRLARAYQIIEEMREVLRAPDRPSMEAGMKRILRRTERRSNVPMRKWHDSLEAHWAQIVALGEHHPPTGRIEALNNNWEALVRRARGYRDLDYLLLKLQFMTANPIRTERGVERFLALGLDPPTRKVA